MGSNRQDMAWIEERAISLMSSLSSCVKKTQECLSKLQSAPEKPPSPATIVASLGRLIDPLLSEVLKSRATVNYLCGAITTNVSLAEPKKAAASAPRSARIKPQNQTATVAPRSRSNKPQNQAAAVAPPSPSISVKTQADAPSLLQPSQPNPPLDTVPQSHVGLYDPDLELLELNIPQQKQAAVASCNTIGPQYVAVPPSIPQEQLQAFQESLEELLNPETDVDNRTKKRRLEALVQSMELPERLKQLDSDLMERILAEIVDQNTNVKWADIAGLEDAKNCVLQTALWPVLNPRIFHGASSIGKGILLFGPPGTGKTMIGKAIAGEMNANLFYISATSLTSKTLVESEQFITALFALARHLHPSVIFLDDIDALLSSRSSYSEHDALRRLKTQLLTEMQDIVSGSERITVIGATNRPQDLDEAARSRLSKRLHIPLPCINARCGIFLNAMEKVGRHMLSEQDLYRICSLTEGYSGSDMKNLIDEAMMGPVRDAIGIGVKEIGVLEPEDLRPLALQDFTNALRKVRPSISQQELVSYSEWNAKFGSKSL